MSPSTIEHGTMWVSIYSTLKGLFSVCTITINLPIAVRCSGNDGENGPDCFS